MNAIVSAFLLTFAALFPIVNPLEGAPFFLGLTKGLPSTERHMLAGKAAVNGFALLLGSMALGPWMLEVFGIQLPVVRIAGGLVVAALGWKLLTQEQWSDHGSGLQAESARKVGSFYPLTMPLTVGPGSMSVAITIGSRKPAGTPRLTDLAEHAGGALLGLTAIAISIYLAYRFAENIARLLGETGLEVLVRLSAFILMCIGIEIVWKRLQHPHEWRAMTAAWELTTIVLRLWVFGVLIVSIISLSDFVFRRPHGVRLLLRRLALGLVWPLAIASSEGRRQLLGKFRGVA